MEAWLVTEAQKKLSYSTALQQMHKLEGEFKQEQAVSTPVFCLALCVLPSRSATYSLVIYSLALLGDCHSQYEGEGVAGAAPAKCSVAAEDA